MRAVGARLRDRVPAAGAPLVTGVTGEGLWLGVQLARPVAARLAAAALSAGFIVNAVTPDVVRLAPPLILTADQADSFVAALPALIQQSTNEEAHR